VPPHHRGLLARLDTLVALAADRHGPDRRGERQVVGLVAGGSSARNVLLWPRGGRPVLDHRQGAF